MKAAIIQPKYSKQIQHADELFAQEISLLDSCDESLDIIVLPEYSDIPAMPDSNESYWNSVEAYHTQLLNKAVETAKRCNAFVFVNGIGERKNTTYAFNRSGTLFGKYYKRHLTEGEMYGRGLDYDYMLNHSSPYVIEEEGIRFGFLTCYDFYFYEAYGVIARQNVDIIIGCSHQRSDTHEASALFSCFAAYNCNAYLLRTSVSMDENATIGGGSMVVSPHGQVLLNMKSRVGMETVEFDPKAKYYKPAGFGNPPSAHYEYVEIGRCPWNYRPGGSAIVAPDSRMPYPRICAQYDAEHLLPAFAAAAALDVNEIAFEVTFDDKGEILAVPVNSYRHEDADMFSALLRKLSCHVIMNIRISKADIKLIRSVIALVNHYDCEKYVYISSEDEKVLELVREFAPRIPRCCCVEALSEDTVLWAFSQGYQKIQFPDTGYTLEAVALAHNKGLRCNVLTAGQEESIRQYHTFGMDTVISVK